MNWTFYFLCASVVGAGAFLYYALTHDNDQQRRKSRPHLSLVVNKDGPTIH